MGSDTLVHPWPRPTGTFDSSETKARGILQESRTLETGKAQDPGVAWEGGGGAGLVTWSEVLANWFGVTNCGSHYEATVSVDEMFQRCLQSTVLKAASCFARERKVLYFFFSFFAR